jgi:AcrR family transcriptional regulator
MPRRSSAQVAASRAAILRTAVAEASVRGFEAASIGHLAEATGMSKSGLIRHFGDKERLQIATLEAGIEVFVTEVWRVAEREPPGLPRLLALCDAWLDFFRREVLPGGCLLTTAIVEYDARSGPVQEVVARTMRRWLAALEREIGVAADAGQLPADVEPADLAFELNALASAASTHHLLSGDPAVFERARRSMRRALGAGDERG